MKKLLTLLLISILLTLPISLAGAESSFVGTEDGLFLELETDNITLTLIDAQLVTQNAAPYLLLTFDFTNHTNEAENYGFSTSVSVYQKGIELDLAYGLDEVNTDNKYKNIKDGATIQLNEAYELLDDTEDIEIILGELFSFNSDDKASAVFSLGQEETPEERNDPFLNIEADEDEDSAFTQKEWEEFSPALAAFENSVFTDEQREEIILLIEEVLMEYGLID